MHFEISNPNYRDLHLEGGSAMTLELAALARETVPVTLMSGEVAAGQGRLTQADQAKGVTVLLAHPAAVLRGQVDWFQCALRGVPYQFEAIERRRYRDAAGDWLDLSFPRSGVRLQRRGAFRIEPKHPYRASVRPTADGEPLPSMTAHDISVEGVGLLLPKELPPGALEVTPLLLQMALKDEMLETEAQLTLQAVRASPVFGHVKAGYRMKLPRDGSRQVQRFVVELQRVRRLTG